MNHWLKLVGSGGLGAAVLFGAVEAAAAPIVDSWSYTLNNAFIDLDRAVIGSGSNPTIGGSTRIEWPIGHDGERSALEVEPDSLGVVSGTVTTNGGTAPGPDLHHINNPIQIEDFPSSGRLAVQAVLRPSDSALGGPTGPFEFLIDFSFMETPNTEPHGFEAQSACDDIFLLVGTSETTHEFTYLGETYTLRFGSERLAALSPEQCAAGGGQAGCIGFLTQEGGTTAFDTFISVTRATPVAEPGPVATLGAGLIALGLVGRRGRAR